MAARGAEVGTADVRLDADKIVDAALEVANELGLAGMTMRRVGARLGVDPTACYRYFASKDDLMAAIADRLFDSMGNDLPTDGTWRERLTALAHGTRAVYTAHPQLVEVLANRSEESPSLQRLNDIAIGCLLEAGLSHREIGISQQMVSAYMIGTGMHEASWGPDPEGARAAARRAYGALDPARYPNVTAVASSLFPSAAEVFDATLTLILDAVELNAAASRARSEQPPNHT